MGEKNSVPAIRFVGFTDDWERRGLSEIADKVTEKNVGLQFVETFTNSAEFGIISQRDFFDHDIAKLDSLGGYYIVRAEDFVYNPRISTSAPVGPINRNKLGRTGVMSPLYTVFRPHDIDTTYLEHFFKCGYWHSFMNFNGDTGARSDRFSIKDEVFFQMPIPMPQIEEQRKIGEYLTYLDYLITLHQRKYSRVCNIKKSMFERMFPREGATVPEIRFAGFMDAWEQRKLPELLKNGSSAMKIGPFGSALRKEVFVEEGVKVYAQENVFTGDFSIGDYYITEEKYRELQSCELYPGDLVISMMGTIGCCAIFPKTARKGIMNSHLLRLQFNNKVIPEYIMFLLKDSDLIRAQIERLSVGSIMSGLSSSIVKKLIFSVPKIEEQKKIVDYLKLIDHLITLHQRELERLQNIKKACLEKMFV